jgi:hypothetical protein
MASPLGARGELLHDVMRGGAGLFHLLQHSVAQSALERPFGLGRYRARRGSSGPPDAIWQGVCIFISLRDI